MTLRRFHVVVIDNDELTDTQALQLFDHGASRPRGTNNGDR